MRVHHALYQNEQALTEWARKRGIQDSASLFVQVYTCSVDRAFIESLVRCIHRLFPQSVLIGCTSNGEILDGSVRSDSTILSFIEFERTTLQTALLPYQPDRDSRQLGRSLLESLDSPDTKAVIAFTSLLEDVDGFLQGATDARADVLLAGGVSSVTDNGSCFLFTKDGLIQDGAVGVALSGKDLLAFNAYSLNWQELGPRFTVTKAEGSRLYSLDHTPITELYSKYLGDSVAGALKVKSQQFPFVLRRDGIQIGRDVLQVHEDGSVTLCGPVEEGETLRLGFGDPELILDNSTRLLASLSALPAEALLIFSCEARRRLMFNSIYRELEPLREIGPTFGFFTRGEFYHSGGRNQLLNHSMTFLMLSESNSLLVPRPVPAFQEPTGVQKEALDAIKAMLHLAQVSTDELVQANTTLELSEQRYRSLAQHNPDMVYSIDRSGRFLTRNEAFYSTLQFQQEEAPQSILELVVQQERERVLTAITQAAEGAPVTFEVQLYRSNGLPVPFSINQFPIVVQGQIVGVYGIAKNVSEQKEAERRITYMAYHDVLTGLPNRNFFYKQLSSCMKQAEAQELTFPVLFVDMDNFKDVNDLHGHFIGDWVLQQIADSLKEVIGRTGFAARFGGDEFAVVLDSGDEQDAEQIARQILELLGRPLVHEGKELLISSSIGISLYPKDGKDPETLLKNADLSMYRAKQSGKNQFQFFNSTLSELTREKRKLIADLRRAVMKEELQVYYQPLMDLASGKLIGSEALVRWFHPEQGAIPPARFIPEAEENGLIDAIGYQVLKKACLQQKLWREKYGWMGTVSVNVSYRQFQHLDFCKVVQSVLEETELPAEALNLEITESTALINLTHTKSLLSRLQQLGVSISMDDFGIGYSSLSCVKDLYMNKLKIDRSFMTNISTDERDAAIVKTIIALSRNLNMRVLAEGVETREQLGKLLEFGCDESQGFLFSRPLPAEEFESMFLVLL